MVFEIKNNENQVNVICNKKEMKKRVGRSIITQSAGTSSWIAAAAITGQLYQCM